MFGIKTMAISTKIILSAFIINKQVSSQSSTNSIARQLTNNAANDILPFYLTANQQRKLAKHGCWCAKLLNPGSEEVGFGGPTKVDELDEICAEWQKACNCLHHVGGSCTGYDELGVDQTSIFVRLADNGLASATNCNIPANDDSCLTGICKVHSHFASKIKEFINEEGFRYTLQRADLSMCTGLKGGMAADTLMQCTGTAPDGLHMIELQCKCQNGEHATGSACPQIDSEFCTSCNSGFHLENNFCVTDQCICNNGETTSSVDCPEHDTSFCTSCNTGYNLNNNQCELNVCVCENGEGSIGTDCPVTDGFKCSSCEQTYHLVGSGCEINQCTCQFGAGMTGCMNDGAAMCGSCIQGYYLDGVVCAVNKCQCPNGLGSTGENCPQNGDFHCTDSGSVSGCDSGYYLNVYLCDLNYCSCDFGTPATGLSCPSNNQEFCESCDSGFDLDNSNTCALKHCTCDNGNPTSGENCPFSGSEFCDACLQGFYLKDNSCSINECQCSNGLGSTGVNCPLNEDLHCTDSGSESGCDSGYYLNVYLCDLNVCSCDFGTPATGLSCPSNNQEFCESCDSGFDLDNSNTCALKQCTCDNGTPAVGATCPFSGLEYCDSCSTGFDLDNVKVCNIKICECDNGLGAIGVSCPSTGDEVCQNCDDGFELIGQSCVLEQCACENGVGVSGVSCPATGVDMCQSCADGFNLENDLCVEKVNFDCSLSGTLINPPESSRSYSTVYANEAIGTGHARSMINSVQAWSAASNNVGQWMIIDLGSDMPVQAMAIQARSGSAQNVQEYQLKYWRSGETVGNGVFAKNENGEVDFVVPKVESGTAYNTVELGESITARYLQIIVQGWINHISMRAGVVQCPNVSNLCSCQNGTPTTGSECPSNNQEFCESCDSGFDLDISNTCALKQCTCDNGTPAAGDCDTNLSEQCSSCNAGYYLNDGSCNLNVCTCENGTPDTEQHCTTHLAQSCFSCDTGYIFDSDQDNEFCRLNCNAGYYLNDGSCNLNVCTCENGTPDTEHCNTHLAQSCNSCDTGYIFDSDQDGEFCRLENESSLNVCTCENGTPDTEHCNTHLAQSCNSCDTGYIFDSDQDGEFCRLENESSLNVCTCENGTPDTEHCNTHLAQSCSSCDTGYIFDSDQDGEFCRLENECTCQNSLPVTENCETNIGCCGETTYSTLDLQCCGTEILSDGHVDGDTGCCGGTFYSTNDGNDLQCCGKELFVIGDWNDDYPDERYEDRGCCGGIVIDLLDLMCCGGEIISDFSCCADIHYSTDTHRCCYESELWNIEDLVEDDVGYTIFYRCPALKQCTCDNGTPAAGESCPFSGSEYCDSCSTGFDLDDVNVCNLKICECDNGLGAIGVNCPSTGDEVCQNCDDGFELIGQTCVLEQCSACDECEGIAMDVVFMLDDTGNDVATVPANHPCQTDPVLDCTKLGITAAGFQSQKEYMKAMIRYFDVSPTTTRIALITFNDAVTVQFDYTAVSEDLYTMIDAVPYTGNSYYRETAAAIWGAITLGQPDNRSARTIRRTYAPDYFVEAEEAKERNGQIQDRSGRTEVQDAAIVITGGPECTVFGTCGWIYWDSVSGVAGTWAGSTDGSPIFAIGSRDPSEQGPSQAELEVTALGDIATVFQTMSYDFTGLDSVAASGVCTSAGTGHITV